MVQRGELPYTTHKPYSGTCRINYIKTCYQSSLMKNAPFSSLRCGTKHSKQKIETKTHNQLASNCGPVWKKQQSLSKQMQKCVAGIISSNKFVTRKNQMTRE
uniref:Uncharacterized protein n=1 Tax=Anopheles coluzzii TaxID=1518534 RepID=A0A6E8WBT4_ANOCL